MIVFDLRCASNGHVFEAWFGCSADYEDQRARGLVECPLCGSGEVEKAAMAPRISTGGEGRGEGERQDQALADPAFIKRMMGEMAAAQKRVLEASEYVGGRFAEEARAIHSGEADERPIHGRASRNETESLLRDGIAVVPLPFPVVPPEAKN